MPYAASVITSIVFVTACIVAFLFALHEGRIDALVVSLIQREKPKDPPPSGCYWVWDAASPSFEPYMMEVSGACIEFIDNDDTMFGWDKPVSPAHRFTHILGPIERPRPPR